MSASLRDGRSRSRPRNLSCGVCYSSMLTNIHACQHCSHVQCAECTTTIQRRALESRTHLYCPQCRSSTCFPRNRALELVLDDLTWSCENDRCLFVGNRQEMRSHRSHCLHAGYPCPLCSECYLLQDLSSHIWENHHRSEDIELPYPRPSIKAYGQYWDGGQMLFIG